MLCSNCGHELVQGAKFCPYCGTRAAQPVQPMQPVQPVQTAQPVLPVPAGPGMDEPVYQADIKKVLRSGKLVVYRDRTEYVTSSVQRAVFNYAGLVSIKKEWDHIDFITEDGRKESCPADRKCVHEAFLYIEQMARPYLAQRKDRLLSQGVQYSFPSSQGVLNDGVLDISAGQVEFKTRSGKSDVVSFRDVKSVSLSSGTLDLLLFDGRVRSFSIGKELRDEVLAFVTDSIAPYLARRKEALLARGIYFSFQGLDGGNLDVLADRVEYTAPSGQLETVSFRDVREAGLYTGMLELALTDGRSRSFTVDQDAESEVLAFVRTAIEPYVAARTVGFDTAFGIDERIEINEERGVFHIIRQGGREITGEWPLEALARCEWVENRELNALGSVVSGSLALFRTAAKAAGSQAAPETEDRISSAGISLAIRAGQGFGTETVWFGIFSAGMSRTNKKYERYLAEWTGLSDYLRERCPACEQIEPVLPEPESQPPEPAAETAAVPAIPQPINTAEVPAETARTSDAAARQEDLGVTRYIEGVSRFIGSCATPMTIAFQGDRGSGKSSVLGMLFDQMEDQYGENLLWLNARQLSRSESGESLSLQVGKKLVEQLRGDSNAAKQTGTLLTGLAGLATGIIVKDISLGKEIADGMLNKNPASPQESPLELFSKQIEAKTRGKNGKVIFFIDGLDQLDPARAVELLDAMRDFFECGGCVFVVSTDSADILRGAQERYDENKAKHFFDSMFKRSFRVPASSFNVKSCAKGKLEAMGVQAAGDAELELYAALIQSSVGRDTEAIDRLFMSFQLLKDMTGGEVYRDGYKRLVLFALLCMQARFRETYDYAVRQRDNVTPEFLAGLCGEAAQPWDMGRTADEMAAYRDFGGVFGQIINLDGKTGISEAECRAFSEVLLISSITS